MISGVHTHLGWFVSLPSTVEYLIHPRPPKQTPQQNLASVLGREGGKQRFFLQSCQTGPKGAKTPFNQLNCPRTKLENMYRHTKMIASQGKTHCATSTRNTPGHAKTQNTQVTVRRSRNQQKQTETIALSMELVHRILKQLH